MTKYVFDSESIKALHAMAKKLYETFKEADRTVLNSVNESYTQNSHLDRSLHPYDYYSFKAFDKELYVRRFRSRYTLECRGFVPKQIARFELDDSKIELYRYCYGSTTDFGEILNLFFDVVHELTELHVKELF